MTASRARSRSVGNLLRVSPRGRDLAGASTAPDGRRAQRDELIEPAVGDDRVVIEQDQVLAAGDLQALVDRPLLNYPDPNYDRVAVIVKSSPSVVPASIVLGASSHSTHTSRVMDLSATFLFL